MDLDRPLDELISDKRKATRTERAERTDRTERPRAPRQSSDRRAPVPYARPPPRSTDEKWVHDAYSGPGAQRGRARDGGGLSTTSVAGTGAGFTGVSPRIEVTGLHYEVTTADLKTIFSQAGTLVQGPTIRYDRSGRSTGTATMEFASYQQAKIAINKFDGAMTKGQTISIRLLPPHQPRPAKGAGGGATGAQSGGSLLSRISGGGAQKQAPSAPRGGGGAGVARGRGSTRGRGAGAGGTGGRAGGGRKAPADAGSLDKELDSFMAGSGDVAME